jgi:hypothetical protein
MPPAVSARLAFMAAFSGHVHRCAWHISRRSMGSMLHVGAQRK